MKASALWGLGVYAAVAVMILLLAGKVFSLTSPPAVEGVATQTTIDRPTAPPVPEVALEVQLSRATIGGKANTRKKRSTRVVTTSKPRKTSGVIAAPSATRSPSIPRLDHAPKTRSVISATRTVTPVMNHPKPPVVKREVDSAVVYRPRNSKPPAVVYVPSSRRATIPREANRGRSTVDYDPASGNVTYRPRPHGPSIDD